MHLINYLNNLLFFQFLMSSLHVETPLQHNNNNFIDTKFVFSEFCFVKVSVSMYENNSATIFNHH